MKWCGILVLLISFVISRADDGMWLPHQMEQLKLEDKGLRMDPGNMFKSDGTGLMSAIVYLGGGTGSFVSSQGLILTNHHVAYRAIQQASTPEKNYLENGFVAMEKSQEIPIPAYYADVLIGYEEVTEQVNSVLKSGMSYREMHDALDKRKKEMIAEIELEAPDRRCKIAAMYSGNKYYLFRFKRLNDLRLVLAPPRALGNFGGDVDNWMWPRHTCDFSFLRAYVSKDNIGVDYDEENVPYQPESVITISTRGVREGDFSFVMGYPGKTYRNYTLAEIQNDIETMKKSIRRRQLHIAFFESAGKDNKSVELKYASRLKSLNNGLKNYQAKLEGFEKAGVIEIKKDLEKEFMQWVNATDERKAKYNNILPEIEKYISRVSDIENQHSLINNLIYYRYGAELPSQAYLIFRIVNERAKPDMERDAKYQEREIPRLLNRIKYAERSYDADTDKEFMKLIMHDWAVKNNGELPNILVELIKQAEEVGIDSYVEELYSTTVLGDAQKRLDLTTMTPEQLTELNDPMINLARKLESWLAEYRSGEEEHDMERMELKKIYLQAMLEKNNNLLATDANGTLRFTYGNISGYRPRDAVRYLPMTTLRGVIEKDTGEFPFEVPDKIKTLYNAKNYGSYADSELKDIVTCFLNETNVTGGSSGSPTINAQGEQIGIIFDMTYESVTGDYYVIPELQRTISVDIRYVLFVTEKFSSAQHIIDELRLK